MKDMAIITCNGNPELAKKICGYLNVPLTPTKVTTFADGEIQIEIEQNVRMKKAYVIQPICNSKNPGAKKPHKENSPNDNLVEMLLMIDALKRASVDKITAVIPYYGYARQDKKVAPRVPISAKLVADLLQVAGAGRIIVMELHAGQLQGFFNIPVDNLYASPVSEKNMGDNFRKPIEENKFVIVSPDAGGVEVARAYAKRLRAGLAIIDKRRTEPNKAKAMAVIGDVDGKVACLLDDMVDTAGTLCEAANALHDKGATEVHAYCCHLVLSPPAVERINGSRIISLTGTDTILESSDASKCKKIKRLSVYEIMAEAIIRANRGDSVTSLFPPAE